MLHIIFYLFATLAVSSAVAVITTRNPVHSVLSLVITFFAMAGIWMIMRAEFLSLILLLVYVGAVMTLFLFVVMMLNIDRESKQRGFVRYLPFGIVLMILVTGLTMVALGPHYFGFAQMPYPIEGDVNASNTAELGMLLYTTYAYPFEIAGVILLAAMIAAISLTHRHVRRRTQNVSAQVAVQKSDRLRIISMPSDAKKGAV